MKPSYLIICLLTFLGLTPAARAQTAASYLFSTGTGVALESTTGATTVIGTGSAFASAAPAASPIGFTFRFAGVAYTQFWVSNSGILRLGSTSPGNGTASYELPGTTVPGLAPLGGSASTGSDGSVSYRVLGTAPTRKLVVDWKTASGTNFAYFRQFQLWLFEGSNDIEFVYGAGSFNNAPTVNIGIATSTSDYLSVDASTHTASSSTVYNSTATTLPAGRYYLFEAPAATPTISSLSPSSGPVGTTVTINGTNLTGLTSVVLRGIPCNITPISATQASFVVPAQASTGPVRLTTTGGTALSSPFTVTRASASLNYVLRSLTFNSIDVGTYSTPAFTDLDHDGLIDMLVGRETGEVSHYEQSAANSTSFTLRANNLSGLTGHYNAIVSVTDIDGDGRLEMVVGNGAGNFKHYEQTAANSTSFTQLSNDFNNIFSTGGISFQSPHFTDIDGDGLLDLLVGDEFLSRWEQTAANGGTFTQLNNQNFGPTADAGNGGSEVCVTDLDGDGRLDILIARSNGQLFHYEQNSANGTAFTQVSTAFSGLNLSGYPAPAITDLDGDGLLDLLVGGADGQLRHYEQAGTPTISSFNPTSGPVGTSVTITGANLDGATSVTVNGTAGNITANTATSLTFTVGAGSTTGLVRVTTPGGFDDSGTSFTVTPSAPVVTGVAVPANGTYGIGQNLDFSVSFDQAVTVNTGGGTPGLALTVGSTARSIAYVSGSGSATLVFRYTVASGDADPNGVTLGSSILLNGGTIRNASGTNATLTLNGVGSTTGVLVDGVAPVPTISSPVGANGGSTSTSPIPFSVSFSESVTGLVIADIAVTNGSKSALSGSGSGPYTFTVTPTGAGAVTVNIAANVATDAGGNGNTAATQFSITYAPAPVVTSVAVPAAGTYGIGQTLDFSVSFDQAMTVSTTGGTPTIGLTVGATSRTATYLSGSGSTTLVFRYTVPSGDLDANGVALASSIALNGGTIRNAGATNATLTLNGVGSTTGVLVDGVAPTVTISSSAGANGGSTSTSPIPFSVSFSESVTGLVIADIVVTNGSKSALSGSGSGPYTFTVTPTGAGAVTVNIAANVATDAGGNGNTAATQFSITYVLPAPTITSFAPTSGPVGTSIVVSGTNLSGATFARVNGTAGSITANTATSLTFTVAAGSTTGAVSVTTAGGTATGSTFTVTVPAPVVTSVAVPAAGTYGIGQTLDFSVSFDQAVTVNTTGGTPTIGLTVGAASRTATYLSGSGSTTLVFRYTVVSGDLDANGVALASSIALNGGTIRNAGATNATLTLNGVGSTTGVLVDGVVPTVVISSTAGTNGGNTSTTPIPVTITFSEAVTGFTNADIVVTNGTKSGYSAAAAPTYTVNVTPTGAAPVTITVNVAAGVATDAGGNGNTAAAAFTLTYAPAPTISAVSPALELPGMPVVIIGTGFTAGSDVSFGGVAATSVTFTSSTSLTAVVPAGVPVGAAAVVVTSNGADSNNGSFTVLRVFNGVTACLASTSYTATGDGQWHYLLTSGGAVMAALQDTRAGLGTVTVSLQATGPASAVRQDGRGRKYLDRNFRIAATNPTFTGSSVNVRFYGLTSEFARLQAADPAVTYANLKATQYSGPNEDCERANNSSSAEYRVLNLAASMPGGGVPWFVAQAAVADHFSEFYLTGSSAPLPVELVAFMAEAQGAAVQLSWRTASEKNSSHFDIERSADGQQFAVIGRVEAQGTSTSPIGYAHRDPQTGPGKRYYRLRQVDLDGTASYSPVRVVDLGAVPSGLALYPNPARTTAQLTGAGPGTVVAVFDALGREVTAVRADAAGAALLVLPPGLPAGVYVVHSGSRALRLVVE